MIQPGKQEAEAPQSLLKSLLTYNAMIAMAMLICGSINTITTKQADRTEASGVSDHEAHTFDHPYVQVMLMFIGEASCMIVYKVMQWRARSQGIADHPVSAEFSPLYLWVTSSLDLLGTSLMYNALNMTYASVYQMLRGFLIVFTATWGALFLKKKQQPYQWTAIGVVLIGLFLVGLSSVIQPPSNADAPHPLMGDVLVVLAQVSSSILMTLESRIMERFSVPPLQVVGWEGVFGLCTSATLLIPYHFLFPGRCIENRMENVTDAYLQIANSPVILWSLVGNVISIGFFNFLGNEVTRCMSATSRTVIDSARTFLIWAFSLIVGWQDFFWLQPLGFAFQMTGTFMYKGIFKIPALFKYEEEKKVVEDTSKQPLLKDEYKTSSETNQKSISSTLIASSSSSSPSVSVSSNNTASLSSIDYTAPTPIVNAQLNINSPTTN
eukprot:TRINITY_DN1558_c0_g1_i1.p1 TRINITY_DN1558_c0_g1~~TRINITY_DN1558_c0_g1_i1.p1  ORF type:complete len:438 (+),score=118.14 TRINITY_DN1558_c0_g1_i1:36-1349(+)